MINSYCFKKKKSPFGQNSMLVFKKVYGKKSEHSSGSLKRHQSNLITSGAHDFRLGLLFTFLVLHLCSLFCQSCFWILMLQTNCPCPLQGGFFNDSHPPKDCSEPPHACGSPSAQERQPLHLQTGGAPWWSFVPLSFKLPITFAKWKLLSSVSE